MRKECTLVLFDDDGNVIPNNITESPNDVIDSKNDVIESAEPQSDDLIIKGAKGIKDGLYNIKDGKLFQYKAKGGTVRTYPIVTIDYAPTPFTIKTTSAEPSGDLISREDAMEAVEARIKWFNGDAVEDRCKRDAFIQVIDILSELPSAETSQNLTEPNKALKGSDLISRADAVKEIHKYFVKEIDKTPTKVDEDGDEVYIDMATANSLLVCNKELSKAIKALPSVDRPTVIRSRTLMPTKDFKEWAKRVREENPNVIVIPCDAEVVCGVPRNLTEEAAIELLRMTGWLDEHDKKIGRPHGEWKHDGSVWANRWVCDKCGHKIFEPQTYFCPNCGSEMEAKA